MGGVGTMRGGGDARGSATILQLGVLRPPGASLSWRADFFTQPRRRSVVPELTPSKDGGLKNLTVWAVRRADRRCENTAGRSVTIYSGGISGGQAGSCGGAACAGRRRAASYPLGAVLRSRLRLRHNPALPPAPGPPDRWWGVGDSLFIVSGVVGVAVHDLVHQLVRPRRASGTPDAGRRDACEPGDVGGDTRGLRRAGADVRPGLRRDTGGAHRLRGPRFGCSPWAWTTQVLRPATGRRGWDARTRRSGPSRAHTSPRGASCSSSLPWASPSWLPARPSARQRFQLLP